MTVPNPFAKNLIPEDVRANVARTRSVERLADDALLMLSKLRDRLAAENANIPACRVDEAVEITLAAARSAMGIERAIEETP